VLFFIFANFDLKNYLDNEERLQHQHTNTHTQVHYGKLFTELTFQSHYEPLSISKLNQFLFGIISADIYGFAADETHETSRPASAHIVMGIFNELNESLGKGESTS
jgi:hypothetical protein